jgi:hypothetical protein
MMKRKGEHAGHATWFLREVICMKALRSEPYELHAARKSTKLELLGSNLSLLPVVDDLPDRFLQ